MNTKTIATVVGSIIALGIGLFMLVGSLTGGGDSLASSSRVRPMIDIETEQVFEQYAVPEDEPLPFENPETGRRTLMPAERCHWTKDGKYSEIPTYVLLNEYKNVNDPTMCPDCGRNVVGHNPLPPDHLIAEYYKDRQAADD